MPFRYLVCMSQDLSALLSHFGSGDILRQAVAWGTLDDDSVNEMVIHFIAGLFVSSLLVNGAKCVLTLKQVS
jgi:hypothetical protein